MILATGDREAAMNDENRIKDKLLDAQRELIAALQGTATKEQVDADRRNAIRADSEPFTGNAGNG